MAGNYSAGRIFLQVVPSFKNLQRDIGRQVKQANADVEKEHEEAGKRAAEAEARGRRKNRDRHDRDELSDYDKLQQKKLEAFQRYSQMMVSERVKERKRQNAEDERDRKERERADRQAQSAIDRKEAKDEARRAAIRKRRARERLAAQRAEAKAAAKAEADAQKEIDRAEAQATADAERKAARDEAKRAARRKRKARERLNGIHEEERAAAKAADKARRDQEKADELARREQQKAADAAQREIERKEARDAQRRRTLLNRRARQRLDDIHRADRAERDRRDSSGGFLGNEIRKAARGAAGDIGEIKVDADTSPAKRELAALQLRLKEIGDAEIGVDLDAGDALAEMKLIRERLAALGKKSADIDVDVHSAVAMAKLKRLEEQIDQINHKKASGGLFSLFSGASQGADEGANSFRIFNWRVLGLLLLIPTLVPVLASAAGALGAIGTAAIGGAAGLGIMAIGFTGLGAAITAMGAVHDNQAKDELQRSKSIRTALKSLRDAEQGVAQQRVQAARASEDAARRVSDAQRNVGDVQTRVARDIKQALRAQEDAERQLARAQKEATKAQTDLMQARIDAQRQQQDLADQIASGRLDERQALIDLFNAQVDYNAVMADGASTNLDKESADIALERARLSIKGIRQQNADLQAEQKKGLDSSGRIADAQDRVAETAQNVKDAQQAVVDADLASKDARINGARDIADAQRDVSDALRDQARTAADNAIAQRDAAERLTDAQAAYQEALTKTGDIGSSSMDQLATAMGKLGPAGQAFATFIYGLYGTFLDLRNLIQEGMLPPLQKEIGDLLKTYGPSFKEFVAVMGKTIGAFFTAFGEALKSPVMKTFFDTMAKFAPIFFTQFGALFIDLMKIIAGLATAFAPFAKEFMDWIVKGADDLAKWAEGLKDSQGFEDFIAYVKQEGPVVWKLIKDIATTLLNLGKGMKDNGFFDAITGFFDMLKDVDPNKLATIISLIAGLAIASQVAAGINALAISLSFLFGSAAGPWVLLAMAIAASLVWLYNNNEDFRKGIDFIWAWIKTTFASFIKWFNESFLPNFETGCEAIGAAFTWLWGYIKGWWNSYVYPLLTIVMDLMKGDFSGAFQTAVDMIAGIWGSLVQLFREPINAVIGFLNDPLFSGINSILDFLGVDKEKRIKIIPQIANEQAYTGPKNVSGKNKTMWDTGGYTGFGGKYEPAGIVHRDEFVLRKEATNKLMAQIGLEGLDYINKTGNLPFGGFAIGGMVKPVNAAPGHAWGSYPSGRRHRAMDFPVREGTPVVMPYPAQVIRDGWDNTGFGNHVRAIFYGTGNGTYGIFGHLMREVVSVGQRLEAGQLLGYSGNTGNSTGPHLHFEMRTSPYDPNTSFDYTAAWRGGRAVTPEVGAQAGGDLPWWADKPLEFMRGLANKAASLIPGNGMFSDMLRGLPNTIFDGARSFIGSLLGTNTGIGEDDASGGKYVWNGREVANNGSQMFDNGGVIQPGVTQVLNMTGKPEPVFTADQYARGDARTGGSPLVGTYAPTFNQSDLTAADVAEDLTHTLARMAHGGKYVGRTF